MEPRMKSAVTLKELLELFRIASEDKQREVVFERIKKLAGNDFEMWFDTFRMALVSEREKEQRSSLEKMKMAKGSFDQWRRVWQFAYMHDETKDEEVAFRKIKKLAGNDFEMWFDIFRIALVCEKKEEQEIAFEEMRKAKSDFEQWQRVRKSAYGTKYAEAAFQEMKNLADGFIEKYRIYRIMFRKGYNWLSDSN